MRITIPARFTGPPGVVNGGYLGGVLAGLLPEAPAVTATLRRPAPVEEPMDVVRDAAGARLTRDGELLADAVGAEIEVGPLDPVTYADAQAATEHYGGLERHPFPTCFGCGTAREDGDALCLRPGRVSGREDTVATPWVPDRSLATDDDDDTIPAEIVWAALDCPGGWSVDLAGRPMVLGRMTARVDGLPTAGERYVVVGRVTGRDGRKAFTESTLFDAGGSPLAVATGTWLAVDPAAVSPGGGPGRG